MNKIYWKADPFLTFICAEMPKHLFWVWWHNMMLDGSRNVPGEGSDIPLSEGCAALSAQLPALHAKLNSGKTPLALLKKEFKVAEFSAHGCFSGIPLPCGVMGWAPAVLGGVAGTQYPDLGVHSLARWFCLINLWDCWLSPGLVWGRHHLALGAQKPDILGL